MRRYISLIAIFFIISLAVLPAYSAVKTAKRPVPSAKTAKAKPKPAAVKPIEWAVKVNQDIISMEWFNRAWDASLKQITKELSTEEAEEKGLIKESKKTLLSQMIEAILLMQWAEREGVTIKEESIKKKITEIKKAFPSPKEFYTSLAEQGMSPEDLNRDIKKQLIIERLINTKMKNLAVSDEEIKTFYEKNTELYGQRDKIKLKQISSKDYDMIKSLRDQAEKGNMGIFEDMGMVGRGQLPIANDSQVFALDAGEISNIISSESGYYVFLVDEKADANGTRFVDVKDNIRNFLLKEKARSQYYKDLAEEKKNAAITVNEKLQYLFE
jgi:glucan-binding YG repeat protein